MFENTQRCAGTQEFERASLKQMRCYTEALAADEAICLAPSDPDNWRRKAEGLCKMHRGREARQAEAEVARLSRGSQGMP
ncbi:hypothetical protein [Reticulibacter mediterranei]|uniref:hypothetical protein n=1 Tax=Reticulibacter mediterranei TaxID=2778369 RepID=UPI001C6921C8|nr:hypothetical protein [Reticulibacter mediterranei]